MILIITTLLLSVSLVSASDTNSNDTFAQTSDTSNLKLLSDSNNQDQSNNDVIKSTEKSTTVEKNILSNQVANTTTSNTNDNTNSLYNTNNQDLTLGSSDDSSSQVVDDSLLSSGGSKKNSNSLKANNKSPVTIKIGSYNVKANQTVTFKANLTYADGTKVDGTLVVFKINGLTIGHANVTKGVASLKYTIPNWKANKYTLNIKMGETSKSSETMVNSTLYVKQDVTISMSSYTVRKNGTITLKATLKNKDGTPLDGDLVVFKVNGVTIGHTNIKNGVASLSYTPELGLGKHNLTVKVGESYKSFAGTKTTTLTINKGKNTSVSTTTFRFIEKGDTVTLSATVLNSSGSAITSGRVTYMIDTRTLGTVSIANGKATYPLNTTNHKLGNHNITVIYNGDTVNDPSSNKYYVRIVSDLNTYNYTQILDAANRTKTYIESNHKLPNYITIGTEQVKPQDLLYLFAKVLYMNVSLTVGDFDKSNCTTSTNCYGDVIYKDEYVSIGRDIVNYYQTYGKSPTRFSSSVGTLSFEDAVYLYARAPAYIYNNGAYPNFCWVWDYSNGTSTSHSVTNNTSSSNTQKKNTSVSTTTFRFIEKGDTVTLSATVLNSSGSAITSGRVTYMIDTRTLGTVSIANGKATYPLNTTNHKLGNHNITVTYNGDNSNNPSSNTYYVRIVSSLNTYSYNQILEAANKTKTFVESNNRLPNYVTIGTEQVKQQDLLYLFAKVLYTNASLAVGYFDKSNCTTSTNCLEEVIYKDEYVSIGRTIVNYYQTYGKSPTRFTSSVGTLSFEDAVYLYARAAAYIYNNGAYPNFCWVWSAGGSSSSTTPNTVTNNTAPQGYSNYLAKTKNCEVNSSVILNVLKAAIKGKSGTYNQAKAIFDYINDNTDYSYYYDTYRGAVKTWNDRKGNCCDLAHLVIAVARSNNIPARYCHSKCYFTSGLVTGHVWAELYVGGTWYSCDATSNRNSFGVINNWYQCTSITRYIELPF